MAGDEGIRRDWVEKDYYKALGVAKSATAAEIKKSYRKLARELHPDANPENKRAEERFKAVSEAYDVLSDESQRKKYDEVRQLYGSGGFRMPGGGASGFSMSDLGNLFGQTAGQSGGVSDIFSGLFNRGGTRQQPHSRRGSDVESEVKISFNDALYGVTLPLRLTNEAACPTCHGTGAKPGTAPRACPSCNGTGSITRSQGGFAFSQPCPECRGRGVVIDNPCPHCQGSGHAPNTRTVQARVPAGVKDQQRIRLKGKGTPGENGGPNGDLYILVHVAPHPVFAREGNNFTIELPVSFAEAALGAPVPVPTPAGGKVTLKLPPGTANGRVFRIREKGAPRRDGSYGDLLAKVMVSVPSTLTAEQRSAIEAFAAASSEIDPRNSLTAKIAQAGG